MIQTTIIAAVVMGVVFIGLCVLYINKAYSKRWDQESEE